MGVQNFEMQSGNLEQQQKLRKAGRLAALGLGALVLLPVGHASAGQCTAGQNFAPGTGIRQAAWDYLCAGADLLTWEFERLILSDIDWDTAFDTPEDAKKELDALKQKQAGLERDIAQNAADIAAIQLQIKQADKRHSELVQEKLSMHPGLGGALHGVEDNKRRLEIWQTEENKLFALWESTDPNQNPEAYAAIKRDLAEATEKREDLEASLKYAQSQYDARNKEFDEARAKADAQYAKINDLKTKLALEETWATKLSDDQIALSQKIANLSQQYGLQQSVAGLPPDASLADRLQRLSWWTNGGVTHNDQWSGPTRSRNTTFSGMIGADMPVSDVSTIGFGLGYSRSAVTQDTAFGGTTDTDTLNLLLKLDWEATGNVSFDMSAAYGISSSHRAAAGGYTDDYLVSNIGLGLGVSSFLDLQDDWRVSGRLGWAGSMNTRYASTDSTGVAQGENTNATSQAQLSAKIEKGLPGIDGSMFADAKLNAVLVDESLIGATSSPFTLEIGAGMDSQVSDAVSFNARAFVGSIGRADQTTFGGSIGLKMSF